VSCCVSNAIQKQKRNDVIKLIKISIEQYDAMLQSLIENLNLKKFDHDISYDQIQSIDMNFNVVENEQNIMTHVLIDNIESLYDALNDVIETLRVHRYAQMRYSRAMTITTNDNDEFVLNDVIYHRMYNEYVERERITIEQIDEFELQNNL
jgi:hypothetical protein